MDILIFGLGPVVRGEVWVVIHRTSGGDTVQVGRPIEVATEEPVVQLKRLGFGVDQIVRARDGLDID